MKTTTKELARAVKKILDESDDPAQTAQAIAAYLVSERRTKDLSGLARELEKNQYAQDGILEVVATSAFPLSGDVKQELQQLFPARVTKLIEKRDKTLVGGVVATGLGQRVDLSVRSKLQKLTTTRGN